MSKLFKNYLSDNFMCNGTTLEGFKEAVKEMVLSTQLLYCLHLTQNFFR